uniref:Uncharacterized protein n=1 Tax=Cacopsylla melanoneura TaxID=428564 RepID=A0A8D8RJ09_9HEMI
MIFVNEEMRCAEIQSVALKMEKNIKSKFLSVQYSSIQIEISFVFRMKCFFALKTTTLLPVFHMQKATEFVELSFLRFLILYGFIYFDFSSRFHQYELVYFWYVTHG